MYRYKCHTCGSLCDPGELENGVCFDCRKEDVERREEHELEIRKELNLLIQSKYRERADGQLVMQYGTN